MIDAKDVSCVIVTRGGVDLNEIHGSMPFSHLRVAYGRENMVYERWLAADKLTFADVIAVQDDDAIVEDWPALLAAYEPGVVTCNMGEAHTRYYTPMGIALVGFGAIFDRSLIAPTFDHYFEHFPKDELFLRECDRVFTGLNRLKIVNLPYHSLPHEQLTPRMWREGRHERDLCEIRERICQVRTGVPIEAPH